MSTGQGSIIRTNRNIPAGVPPFPANSARNGLSVDATGFIVLGQDVGAVGNPAALLNNREIPLAGFLLEATSGGNRQFVLDPTNGVYIFGDIDGGTNGTFFEIDNLGDVIINSQLQSYLTILAPASGGIITLQMNGGSPGGMGWTLDGINGDILQGDNFGGGNTTQFLLDDTNQLSAIGQDPTNIFPWLYLDGANRDFALGDFFGAHNSNYVECDDVTQRIVVNGSGDIRIEAGNSTRLRQNTNGGALTYTQAGAPYLQLDPLGTAGFGSPNWSMGDINGALNSCFIRLENNAKIFRVNLGANPRSWIVADDTNKNVAFGDIQGSNQGTVIQVSDAVGLGIISMGNTANNAIVRMNNVNGFTGTVAPVNTITVNGGIVTNVA